jgi:hypothetical protein
MFKISSGTIVLMGVADGWFVTKQLQLSAQLSVAVACGFLLLAAIAILSLWSHHREFCASARMIVRVERALGFYDSGLYVSMEALYETASQAWGSGAYERHILIAQSGAVGLFSIFSVLLVSLV